MFSHRCSLIRPTRPISYPVSPPHDVHTFSHKQLLAALAREADQLPAALEHSLTGKPSPVYCHHAVPPTMDSTYRAHFEEKDMTGTM